MDYGRIICAAIGFSASIFLCLQNLKKQQSKQIAREKLTIVREALEDAEERAARYAERHDRILGQIGSYYLVNRELEEALAGARAAMDGALECALVLRDMQTNLTVSYLSGHDSSDVFVLKRYRSSSSSSRSKARLRNN